MTSFIKKRIANFKKKLVSLFLIIKLLLIDKILNFVYFIKIFLEL